MIKTAKYICEIFFACSSSIQQCLMTGSVWEAIRAIDSMGAVHARLKASGCSYLKEFLQETLTFWHKIIKDRLSRYRINEHCFTCSLQELNPLQFFFCSDFEKILTQLQWPNISPTAQSPVSTGNYQEQNVQLELLVTQLLALQTTYPSAICSRF